MPEPKDYPRHVREHDVCITGTLTAFQCELIYGQRNTPVLQSAPQAWTASKRSQIKRAPPIAAVPGEVPDLRSCSMFRQNVDF